MICKLQYNLILNKSASLSQTYLKLFTEILDKYYS